MKDLAIGTAIVAAILAPFLFVAWVDTLPLFWQGAIGLTCMAILVWFVTNVTRIIIEEMKKNG